jgi:predicted nucleotide-binding protein
MKTLTSRAGKDIDRARLRAIVQKLDDLTAAGKLDSEAFRKLEVEGLEACGGATDIWEAVASGVDTEERLLLFSETSLKGKVFIGHGRSPVWQDLRDFLRDRLHVEWTDFNRDAIAGYATKERLEQMLADASFAFLVMTAEDEHAGGALHARENVVHEVGLFQGRLGFLRAIILLEEGCSEFSNIVGLSQIRFPKGNIMAKSEEIRKVLERELVHSVSDLVTTEIRFDYLPDPLTKHGWKPAYKEQLEPEPGAYSSPTDAPVSGCLSIKTALTYALDYRLPPTVCDGLQFEAQYSDATMLFTELVLKSRDGSLSARKWIKFYVSSGGGGIRGVVTDGYPNEYTLWWPATALPQRWVSLNISLTEAVRQTWGKQGWTYESLATFRIRGPLSISPIRITSGRAARGSLPT